MRYFVMALVVWMLLLTLSQADAAPALPKQITVTQADGTVLAAKIQGDEYQHWVESTDSGHTIVKNPATGNWEYAMVGPDGSLTPCNMKVTPSAHNAPGFIPTGLKPPRAKERESARGSALRTQLQQRILQASALASGTAPRSGSLASSPSGSVSGNAPAWTATSVSGARKLLVVLVNFSNRTLVTTPQQWSQAIFSATPGDKSVANYYAQNSLGNLTVQPLAHTQPGSPAGVLSVTVNLPHEYSGTSESAWVQAALDQVANWADLALLDADGNDVIDPAEALVYFVAAGYEKSGSTKTPSVWAHAYFGGDAQIAGKTLAVWARSGELNAQDQRHPIGVVAHELGHQMVGLPDLYDTSSVNAGLGGYSLMSTGSWGADEGESIGTTPVGLDAWSREYAGWTAPVVPQGSGTVTLDSTRSADNTLKLINPLYSSSEYFLVENRQPQGWDLGLTYFLGAGWSGGLLIEHVDNAMGSNAFGAAAHQGLTVVQASNSSCNMLGSRYCYGNQRFFFYGGNNGSFNNNSAPPSRFYNGAASFRSLDNISGTGSVMTALFSQGGSAPTGTIKVNAGAPLTNSLAVKLLLSAGVAPPSALRDMCFSNDGSTWTDWESYKSSRAWTLEDTGDGPRTVQVKYRDTAGNVSIAYAATITVDTVPPEAVIVLNGSVTEVGKATTISFAASNTDAVAYKYRLDGSSWSAEIPVSTTMAVKGLGNGSHLLCVIAKDAAGNWQSAASPALLSWTVDNTTPVSSATPPGGNYETPQSVALSATKNATIHYTTNGITPTTASAVYSAPIPISAKTVLKFFAVDALGNTETSKTHTYQFPASAVISGVTGVTRLSGATISVGGTGIVSYRYQLDGGADSGEIPVSSKIVLSGLSAGAHTIAVFGKSSLGLWQQSPTTASWTIEQTPPVTSASLASGVYAPGQSVTLTANEPAKIYYTLNGGTPTTSSSSYAVPLVINATTTLKFLAVDKVGNAEAVQTRTYTVTQLSGTPPPLTKLSAATLTVSGTGVAGYAYALDGGTRSAERPLTTKISLAALSDGAHTVSVYGKRSDGVWQDTPTQVSWTVSHSAAQTSATPAGGSYAGPQSVTLSSSGPATIYYTLNGAIPTASSTRYAAPISVATSTVIKFFSVDAAGNVETVKTESYTVQPTTVVTGVAALTRIASATLSVSGSGVVAYRYQLDGGGFGPETPVASRIVLSALAAGSHTVGVIGRDKSGLWQDTPSTISWTVQQTPPVSSVVLPDGVYPPGQTVTLSTSEGARIYYTANGTTPTTASPVYTGPLTINSSVTLKFFAVDAVGNTEAVNTRSYVITSVSGTPTTPTRSTVATLTVTGSGLVSYVYTVDGGAPSAETPVSRKISLVGLADGEHTVAVRGKRSDGTWQVTPTQVQWSLDTLPVATRPSPPGGTYSEAQAVTLETEPGAVIYFTTDGSVPSAKSPRYSDPILITRSTTLKFLGVDAAGNQETVRVQNYAIPPVARVGGIAATAAVGAPLAFVVGGDYVSSFKYNLDGTGWSGEVPVTVQKTLSGMSVGTHRLQVLARDAAGVWQDAASPTAAIWVIQ